MAAATGDLVITLRVLATVNEERNSHGLRYHDYARYRKHCTNKIHRLRQTLRLSHGKEKTFKKPPPVAFEKLKDGHLLLDLLETERAWAYAQKLVLEHTKTAQRTTRRMALSRFRKAIECADRLNERSTAFFADKKISSISHTEILAYRLMLLGRFFRTKHIFDDALAHLAVSRALLDKLSSAASSSRDQALYSVFIDEISPEIRFCAHQMGREKAYAIDDIVADLAPKCGATLVPGYADLLDSLKASGSVTDDLEPLMWEDQPVPVRSPELVDAFLRVQQAVKRLHGDGGKKKVAGAAATSGTQSAEVSRGKIASFDGVLSALSDAESLARKLAESQQPNASDDNAGPGARDPHFIHAYISFRLLAYRIQRDLLLVEALLQPAPLGGQKKTAPTPAEATVDIRVYPAVIKTLDTVLQSLEQMRSLSISDETPDVATALDVRVSYTKAKRGRYLSLAHAAVKNYASAIALNSNAHIYLREATSLDEPSPPEVSFFQPDPTQGDVMPALEVSLDEDAQRMKKEWFAHNGGVVDSQGKHKKPLFFDVAFNYVESPLDRIQVRAGKAPAVPKPVEKAAAATKRGRVEADETEDEKEAVTAPQPAAGITGFLGSWWGRK